MSPRCRIGVAACLALAVLAGGLWLQGFAPHTDDGCQIEIHCLACRSGYARTADVAIARPLAIALAPAGSPSLEVSAARTPAPPSRPTTRGPPPSA